jgi:hypothetical protein
MRKVLIIAIAILLFSCNAEKRCQKHINKAKILGCLSETDSSKVITKYIKGDSIHDTTKLVITQTDIDSLYLLDTCYTKARVNKIFKYAKIKPINVDNKTYKLDIKVENGLLIYDLIIKDRVDTTQVNNHSYNVTKPKGKSFDIPNNWIVLVVLLVILYALKKFFS